MQRRQRHGQHPKEQMREHVHCSLGEVVPGAGEREAFRHDLGGGAGGRDSIVEGLVAIGLQIVAEQEEGDHIVREDPWNVEEGRRVTQWRQAETDPPQSGGVAVVAGAPDGEAVGRIGPRKAWVSSIGEMWMKTLVMCACAGRPATAKGEDAPRERSVRHHEEDLEGTRGGRHGPQVQGEPVGKVAKVSSRKCLPSARKVYTGARSADGFQCVPQVEG